MAHSGSPLLDDEGEAFARAVFGRFLRQATICRDIDDAIEHMHIVNDNSETFDIRLGGEARIPVGRELIVALASKKKELLALCESALRAPRTAAARSASVHAHDRGTASSVGVPSTGTNPSGVAAGTLPPPAPQPLLFPPPAALAAMDPTFSGSAAMIARPSVIASSAGTANGAVPPLQPNVVAETAIEAAERAPAVAQPATMSQAQPPASAVGQNINAPEITTPAGSPRPRHRSSVPLVRDSKGPTTVFVRKVDMKTPKEDIIEHFKAFGEVIGISMNPTRGFAFIDYPSHDCVLRAISAPEHVVNRKSLEVEAKKEPTMRMYPPGARTTAGSGEV